MPTSHYLWKLRPYYRLTAGQLLLGSLSGIAMNIAALLALEAAGWDWQMR